MSPPAANLENLLARNTVPAAADLTHREGDGAVRCLACGHRCRVAPDGHGVCHVRFNRSGELHVPFGYVSSLAADPIEKKPFYHAYPGSEALSFGMLGCNFHCPFCQNWVTSQTLRDRLAVAEPHFVTAEQVVELALKRHCPVLTSTYNEPLITTEWALAIFKLGQAHGLVGSYVTNGHATPEVLECLRPYAPLLSIDLKALREETYRKLGGKLEHVVDTIRRARHMDFWIELTTLVVPDMNDSDEELRQIAEFIASVSPEIPWHVTAFYPTYRLTEPPPTPVETLVRAYEIGRAAGLKFVYAGNLPGQVGHREHTHCPACDEVLIERRGFYVRQNHLRDGHCPTCGERIAGVWGNSAAE